MGPRREASSKLDDTVAECLGKERFAGAVVRIEKRGGVWENAWGNAVFTETEHAAMTKDCRFDIASLSKLFTATAILRLASLGEISLETKAAEILEVSPLKLPRTESALGVATIRKLLTHSTGFHYWYPFYASGKSDFFEILEEVFAEHPLKNDVIYSDLNFMVLGKIVEAVAGAPLGAAMRDLVFSPLGLSATGYMGKGEGSFHRRARTSAGEGCAGASGHAVVAATEFGNRIEMGMVADLGLEFGAWRDTREPIRGEADDGNCYYYFGGAAGHAGVFSTAADVCKLGSLYLDGGRGAPDDAAAPYLTAEIAEEASIDQGGNRGLGFQLGDLYPCGGFGHTGFTGAYLYCNREKGVVAAALTNRLHVPRPEKILDFYRNVGEAACQL